MILAALGAAVPWFSQAASPAPFRVVVSPQNSATSVDRKFLADAFLKKVARWPDGEALRPVDLSAELPARARFSEDVIRRSVLAVRSYWQQQVFSGRDVPPPEMDTDDEVLRYVLRFPGAVGYVSGAADVERVKVVTVK